MCEKYKIFQSHGNPIFSRLTISHVVGVRSTEDSARRAALRTCWHEFGRRGLLDTDLGTYGLGNALD